MLLIRWLNNLNNQNELTTPITVNPSENEVSTRESQVIAEQHTSLRISPLPPPEDFAKYKEIMPDLPERIVKQFEEDSITARELQKERQTAEIELQKYAQNTDISFDKRGFCVDNGRDNRHNNISLLRQRYCRFCNSLKYVGVSV